MTKTDSTALRYVCQAIVLMLILSAVCMAVKAQWGIDGIATAVGVSLTFGLVVETADAMAWRMVAKRSPESLPTFFMAMSMFRLLLALAVMTVYYLVAGQAGILVFFCVFMAFCLALIAHHAIFFARIQR